MLSRTLHVCKIHLPPALTSKQTTNQHSLIEVSVDFWSSREADVGNPLAILHSQGTISIPLESDPGYLTNESSIFTVPFSSGMHRLQRQERADKGHECITAFSLRKTAEHRAAAESSWTRK